MLTDATITIPLRPYFAPGSNEVAIPSRHAIGVYGRNATNVADAAHAMIAHFTAFHSPQEARVFVLGSPTAHNGWEWAEWLPHCFVRNIGDDDTGRP